MVAEVPKKARDVPTDILSGCRTYLKVQMCRYQYSDGRMRYKLGILFIGSFVFILRGSRSFTLKGMWISVKMEVNVVLVLGFSDQ